MDSSLLELEVDSRVTFDIVLFQKQIELISSYAFLQGKILKGNEVVQSSQTYPLTTYFHLPFPLHCTNPGASNRCDRNKHDCYGASISNPSPSPLHTLPLALSNDAPEIDRRDVMY